MLYINPFNAAYLGNLSDLEKWYDTPNSSLSIRNKERNNASLLYTAANQGHVHIVKWLIQKGVDPSEPGHDTGSTALHTAAYNGRTEVVKVLLAQSGIKKDVKNKFGEIPLSCAVERKHDDIIKLLDPNKNNTLELEGVPIIIPNHEHSLQLCKTLSDHKCDICSASFNDRLGLQGYRCTMQNLCDYDVCLNCLCQIFQTQLQKTTSELEHSTSQVSALNVQLEKSNQKNDELEKINEIQAKELAQFKNLKNEYDIAKNEYDIAKNEFEHKWVVFSQDVAQIFGFSSHSSNPIHQHLPIQLPVPDTIEDDDNTRMNFDAHDHLRMNFNAHIRDSIPENKNRIPQETNLRKYM